MANLDSGDLVLIIIAIFFPPVTAVITDGCGGQFCLNILLTILGFLPGLAHAVWLVFRRAERETAAGTRVPNYGRHHHHNQDQRPIYVQQPGPPPTENVANYGAVPVQQQGTGYQQVPVQHGGKVL